MSSTFGTPQPDLPHADDEMLTMKEVSALLRVPEATLRYWRTEVALWLEEQSRHPQDEI